MRGYRRYRELTEEEIKEIRRRLGQEESYAKISEELGIPSHKARESNPGYKRRTRKYQRHYQTQRYNIYKQSKNQEIDSYLKKFKKISTLFEYGDIKDVEYFQDFLQDPFSLIIKSLGKYKQKLKTIRECIEEECNTEETFERDRRGNLKVSSYIKKLMDKELIEYEVRTRKARLRLYYLSEYGKEIYEIITQLDSLFLDF